MANQQMYDYDGMESLVLEVIKDYKAENGADKTPLEDYIHDKINVSCSLSTVHKTIERLIEKGVLIKTGYGRARTLYLAEDGYDFLKEPKEEILQDVVHDFGWALQQMRAGEKVCNGNDRNHYYNIYENGLYSGNTGCNIEGRLDSINTANVLATDWQIYVPKPQWTDEEIEYAKHLKGLGLNYLARDEDGLLSGFANYPHKKISVHVWKIAGLDNMYLYLGDICNGKFSNIKWEDDMPTALDDIINSKESEKQCN